MGAWRVLTGREESGPEDTRNELQGLADALDLMPVPGFFAARTDGPGELVTVAVRRLWPAPVPARLAVSLWWLPPEGRGGREPVRARREPATAEAFLAAAREPQADLIGCSALLTTTMGNMRDVIAAVAEADDLPHLRVIIGGAPVTLEFASDIGAHGWAPDAASAVHVATAVVETARGKRDLDGLIHPEALAASA